MVEEEAEVVEALFVALRLQDESAEVGKDHVQGSVGFESKLLALSRGSQAGEEQLEIGCELQKLEDVKDRPGNMECSTDSRKPELPQFLM